MPDLKTPERWIQVLALYDHLSNQATTYESGRRLWSGGFTNAAIQAVGVTGTTLATPLRHLLEQMGAISVLSCLPSAGTVLELHERPTWETWIACGGKLPQRRLHQTDQATLHERALTAYAKRLQLDRERVIASIAAIPLTARRRTTPLLPCVGFVSDAEHHCKVQGLDSTVPRGSYAKDSTAPMEISEPRDDGMVQVTVHRCGRPPVSFDLPADLLDTAPKARSNREGTGQTLSPPKTPKNEPPLVTARHGNGR